MYNRTKFGSLPSQTFPLSPSTRSPEVTTVNRLVYTDLPRLTMGLHPDRLKIL